MVKSNGEVLEYVDWLYWAKPLLDLIAKAVFETPVLLIGLFGLYTTFALSLPWIRVHLFKA